MQRRDFITLLGSAAATWPLAASAQEPSGVRRIGVLMNISSDDPEGKNRVAAFVLSLEQLGWVDGRNVQIVTRWSSGDVERVRRQATELVAQLPDVILASGSAAAAPLLQATRAVPIVFVNTPDPVGAGYVKNLARPGGNATGFLLFEYSIGGKWLDLLKQIAPEVNRVAVLRDAAISAGLGQYAAVQSAAASFGVEVSAVDLRDVSEIERDIAAFATTPGGGLVVSASPIATSHRDLIVKLAARHKLPAIYYERFFVAEGGLISYGPDIVDQFRRAPSYVDRILKGEKPADLPVQAPTKYELVINLKTAKALNLNVPNTLIGRADQLIE
jgi:ABC-type uncharacterized transport system substrate-binding protein